MTIDYRINDDVNELAPPEECFEEWVTVALGDRAPSTLVNIVIVSPKTMRDLNKQYRDKDSVTNVLSFNIDAEVDGQTVLGDVVLCPNRVVEEAKAQNKNFIHHWTHLAVHGVLHLLGYDHENEQDAEVMEAKEIALLEVLSVPNPYEAL